MKRKKTPKKTPSRKPNDDSNRTYKRGLQDLGLIVAILLALLAPIHRGKDGLQYYLMDGGHADRMNASVATTSTTAATNASFNCLEQRGMSGKWILDWDYANQTDYTMLGSYSGTWHLANELFRPSPDHPFRSATAWIWQDDNCPVHLLTDPNGFCQVSKQLNISRYAILGDSMACQFFMSLLHLLKMNVPKRRTTFNGIYRRPFVLNCPDNHQIQLWLWRLSPLSDLQNLLLSEEHGLRSFFNQKDQPSRGDKTAILFNTGSWMPTLADFQLGFQAYIQWMDTFDPDKILVFWRPSVPGHLDCQPQATGAINTTQGFDWTADHLMEDRPYTDYEDYQQTTQAVLRAKHNTSTYNWLQIEEYNIYSRVVLRQRAKEALLNTSSHQANRAHIHWLNIFHSTILRRDGHVGFVDCEHYYLPGPTDWWVHFFYSMLLDLSAL